MNDHQEDEYDDWFGRPIAEVPPHLRQAVFEHIVGFGLEELTLRATKSARHFLRVLDPERADDYEDVAQDIVLSMAAKLPSERINSWTYIGNRVKMRVQERRRNRLVAKRPKVVAGAFNEMVATIDSVDPTGVGGDERWVEVRSVVEAAVDRVLSEEQRAVILVCYPLTQQSADYVEPSPADVLAQLRRRYPPESRWSDSKVKRLRVEAKKLLRAHIDQEELES